MASQKGTDFDNARTNTRTDKVKVTDLINLFKFPEKKWVTGRFYGPLHSYATGWIKGKNKEGKPIKFPVNMPSYDPETQQFDSTKYDPWYAIYESEKDVEREKQTVQINRKFYGNLLSRSALRQKPSTRTKPNAQERKSGFKDKDSDTWTPWVPVALPPGVIQKIQELKGLNVVESAKTGSSKGYSVAHEKFGCDIRIYYDPSKAPADQYQVQMGDRTPLSEIELAYLRWDTSNLAEEATEEEIKRDYEGWASRMGIKKKGKKVKDEEEDEDLDDDDDSDDDEDDEPVSKSKSKKVVKKPVSKSKRASKDEDEDDDTDDDDLDDDEDDEPPAKSKAKAKGKSKKVEDEDDDDLDDDDSDDEDDDSDDDSDDEDEDDADSEDDDEDDEPPAKSKSKSKAKAPAKGKRPSKKSDEDEDEDSDDDGDEDDEDSDDDEDEDLDDDSDDDEPPAKSKSTKKVTKPAANSKSVKKPVSKKKVVEEDEDEDLDDDDLDDDDDEPPPAKKKVVKKPVKRK